MKAIEAKSVLSARRITAAATSPAFDLGPYLGEMMLVLDSSATEGAGQTSDTTVEHCDTATGTFVSAGIAFSQVTNAGASHQTKKANVDSLKRYVRTVTTIVGTAAAVTVGISLVAKRQDV